MPTQVTRPSDTKAELQIVADAEQLKEIKQAVLKALQPEVSAPGFRKGKVPLNVVEKHVDPAHFEREFLDEAMTALYRHELDENDLRPVDNPEVNVTKFVPYTTLEFTVSVEVVPPIKLPDYSKFKVTEVDLDVNEKEIDTVIENIQTRLAEKKTVKRAAKEGDEVVIDFVGFNEKGEKLQGGSGNDYPLAIGSKTFIPGFEEEVEGLKTGDDKTFDVVFPKDYHSKSLAGIKASFTINVKEVKEVAKPEVDDKLAAKAGPFKNVPELRADILKQLSHQKQQESGQRARNEMLDQLADKTKLELPESLVVSQTETLKNEQIQNLVYRGLTWDEFLSQSGLDEENYLKDSLRPEAEKRVKIGLALSEVSKIEKIDVTPEELEIRIQLMKGQYQDIETQKQLDQPEVRRDLLSQLLSEKTVEFMFEKVAK